MTPDRERHMTDDIASAARRIVEKAYIYPRACVDVASAYLQLREKNNALVKALRETYEACLSGDFYADYDEASARLGRMRAVLSNHGADDGR